MKKKLLKHLVDLIMKVLIILSIWIAILALFKPELIKQWLDWVKETVIELWSWNYLIVFISSLIESFPVLWVVIPGQNILLAVGGFFADTNTKLYYLILLTSIWAILWNYIGFFLWKIYWEDFFIKYWLWFGIWETELKYLKKGLNKWWPWWIALWKFHWVTRAFLPFIAWTMWMKSKVFWLYNILGSILRSICMILLAKFFADNYEQILENFGKIMIWIMVLTWLYIWKFKKKEFKEFMIEKNAEMDRKYWTKK